jgi:GNAT superfamily N-acetyltransferase
LAKTYLKELKAKVQFRNLKMEFGDNINMEMELQELKFVRDYKNNEALRKSFSQLATDTFGITFENWFQKGFWNERYIPFSFADRGKVIANVSVNLLDLVIDGKSKRAIQIGTVMTHPDYRKKGLSANLMNRVLEEYKDKYDIMYLFANKTVLNFYPKFGFTPIDEYIYYMEYSSNRIDYTGIRKLDGSQADDLSFIYKFASERLPVSQRFGTVYAEGILMFYCMNVFCNDIYYLEHEDVIAIYKKENSQLDIFDIIYKKEINILDILAKIADHDIEKIVFHFTPNFEDNNLEKNMLYSGLFVRTYGENHFPENVKHPITSIA